MTHKPTVNVSYEEYHKMQQELEKLNKLKSSGTVWGYAWCRRTNQELLDITFTGMKHTKAVAALQEAVREVKIEITKLDRALYNANEEIERLKSRNLWQRIWNK